MRADPIFVDRTGRRRRLFAVAGAGAGILLVLAALVLVAGFTGAGPGYLPTLPLPAGGEVRGAVSSTNPPATSTIPAPTPQPGAPSSTVLPGTAATAAPPTVTTPSPTRSNHRRVPTHTPGNKPSKQA